MIQKTFRGYLVRREFISIDFNPIVKIKNPPLYLAEAIIYEIINDSIIDSLVGICQSEYHPISRHLKAPNMFHHIVDQMIHEIAINSLNEAKLKKKGIIISEKWESTEQLILLEELNHFAKDILLETIDERVKGKMLEMNSEIAFSLLHDEIVRDDIMTLLHDVIIDIVFDVLVHEIIRKEIFQIAPSLCKLANVCLLLDRPSKRKSKRMDAKMNKLLDEIVFEELALALASPSIDTELDKEIDFAIVNTILHSNL